MLRTAYIGLYVLALLSFGSIAIEATDPYTGLQLQLILNGIGLGVLLHALHAHRSGVLDIATHRQSRETSELMFRINLFLMVVAGLMAEAVSLMMLAAS